MLYLRKWIKWQSSFVFCESIKCFDSEDGSIVGCIIGGTHRISRMKLTIEQQAWVDKVVGNGMPAVEEALAWASDTTWGKQHDSIAEVAQYLKLDLTQDHDMNRAKSKAQAYKFIGILEKIGTIV